MAYQACGIAGLICVIVAGWTTANPTIYRAGLAFQAIVPRSSRFVVTLVTGAIATIAGMFPAIAMQLLGFVAIYGMILMPMGAVIFVDFWLLPKLGLRSSYAEFSGTPVQLGRRADLVPDPRGLRGAGDLRGDRDLLRQPARLVRRGGPVHRPEQVHPEGDGPPGRARRGGGPIMTRIVAQVVSWLALAGTILPPFLFFTGRIDLDTTKVAMLVATVVWYVATPFWMGRERRIPRARPGDR